MMEFTVRDHVLAKLRQAKNGLRRNSIDELEALVAFCRDVPREDWPPDLVAFVRRSFKRAPGGRLVFKRPPYRMRSRRRDFGRWFGDPNRFAAYLAAIDIAQMRGTTGKTSKRQGRYKLADGANVTEAAVRRAVYRVNSNPGYRRGKSAHIDVVKSLVRRGRTRRPLSRLKS